MKCPYINPTIQQCENCPLDDCVRNDTNIQVAEWRKENPEKQRAIRRRQYINHIEREKANARKQYQAIRNNPKALAEYREYERKRQKAYRERVKRERQAG